MYLGHGMNSVSGHVSLYKKKQSEQQPLPTNYDTKFIKCDNTGQYKLQHRNVECSSQQWALNQPEPADELEITSESAAEPSPPPECTHTLTAHATILQHLH